MRRLRLSVRMPLLALACLFAAGLTGRRLEADGDEEHELRIAPNLYGRTGEEARRMLAAQGLRGPVGEDGIGIVGGPAGRVVDRQNPRAGSYVAVDTAVRVTWRTQPDGRRPTVAAPQLLGMTRESARVAAEAAGFYLRVRYARNDLPDVEGRVSGQSPGAGVPVLPGSVLHASIHLRRGAATPSLGLVSVPDLLGRRRAEAVGLVREAGLEGPVALAEVGGDLGSHVVGRQFPAPRDRVERGTTVRVGWVAPGPGAALAVPEVRGMTLAHAREVLAATGLAVDVAYAPRDEPGLGTVYEQAPAAGHSVARASVVRITVNSIGVTSRGGRVTVPPLFRMTPEEAHAALAAVGLRMRRDPTRYTSADIAGLRFMRPPMPGRAWGWAPAGTATTGDEVTVKFMDTTSMPDGVPSDATMVTMPDLKWRTRDQVERTLSALGLRGWLHDADSVYLGHSFPEGFRYGRPPRGTPAGGAWYQKPRAGTQLAIGTQVEVVFKEVHIGGAFAPADVVVVPDLRGISAAAAIARLRTQRLEGSIDPATRPAGRRDSRLEVTGQEPVAGAQRPAGTNIVLRVRAMRSTVPALAGLGKEAAADRLRDAWLQPRFTGPVVPPGYRTRITRQWPAQGALVAEMSVVQADYVLDGPIVPR